MSTAATPTAPSERIATLDILRAFALFGIFLMNLPGFYYPFWDDREITQMFPHRLDQIALGVGELIFSGKMNSLFSALFGLGFGLQLTRLSERSSTPARIYLRRLAVLLGFGLAHLFLLWNGDVLHMYAVLGVVLLLVRNWSTRMLAGLAVCCLLADPLFSTYRNLYPDQARISRQKAQMAEMRPLTEHAYQQGSYGEVLRVRAREVRLQYDDADALEFWAMMAATTLIGFLAGRQRWLQRALAAPDWLRRWQWRCFAVGLMSALTAAAIIPFLKPYTPSPLNIILAFAYGLQRPALMLFYAAVFVRLIHSERWGPRVAGMQDAGRMPLTNYLMQSVIGTTLCYGYGFGWWRYISPASAWLFWAAVVALQIWYSRVWLRHYQFGPLEWLWRALTYGRAPQLRAGHRATAAA